MQLIYQGKTGESLAKMKFSDSFSLSISAIHYSNENEASKFTEEIILPYIWEELEKLECPNQKALFIFDVFWGHILKVLEDHNILATKTLHNMTHLFQLLD